MRRTVKGSKKLRNNINDVSRNPHVLSRKFNRVTCHKCGAMGHSIKSCKGKRVADKVIPKDRNKTEKTKTINKEKKIAKTKTTTEIRISSQAPHPTQTQNCNKVVIYEQRFLHPRLGFLQVYGFFVMNKVVTVLSILFWALFSKMQHQYAFLRQFMISPLYILRDPA